MPKINVFYRLYLNKTARLKSYIIETFWSTMLQITNIFYKDGAQRLLNFRHFRHFRSF